MEWISVKDRLPPKDKKIIFYRKDFDIANVGKWLEEGTYGDPDWFQEDEEYIIGEYSHWMLLPESPKD